MVDEPNLSCRKHADPEKLKTLAVVVPAASHDYLG